MGSLWDEITTWAGNNTSDAIGTAAGVAGVYKAYDDLGGIGDTALSKAGSLADTMQSQSQFKPYGVTTGSGAGFGMQQDPITGQMSYQTSLSDSEMNLQNTMQTNALTALSNANPKGYGNIQDSAYQANMAGQDFMTRAGQGTGSRESDIYNRMRAMQSPEEERQRMMLEERQFNQGRQGVSTAMYGGTPEQLAMQKAQAEAQNTASVQAIQQAQAEQMQQAQIGQQYKQLQGQLATQGSGLMTAEQQRGLSGLQGSYIPQAGMLDALQPGMTAAAAQQQNQQYGLGLWGETQMSGLDAYLGANLGAGNLLGNAASGVLAGIYGNKGE